jgi:hypothetical protein
MAHALRIFAVMKTKLTLSVSKARVRRVKAYSAKRKKSVSQLFEEFVDALEEAPVEPGTGKKAKRKYLVDQFAGMLTGKFTDEDYKKDPRLARIMGRGR